MALPFISQSPLSPDAAPGTDLWDYLSGTDKPIVMYGMGNGADKILAVCEQKHITVRDFFASDGFVRGHSFHGKVVLSYSEVKARYGAENLIVLLSFGTSLPQVLSLIHQVASETELYAPDVPVCGETLFDLSFFRTHLSQLSAARDLLCDQTSRQIFDCVIRYKLTGDIRYLDAAVSDPTEVLTQPLTPTVWHTYADLGAYNGDTVRQTLETAPGLRTVWALEPDSRNFRKLKAYADQETRAAVHALNMGAWSHADRLPFDASGNRNAGLHAAGKTVDVPVDALDNLTGSVPVDFIKYDVEGAEREALIGSQRIIREYRPQLLVSAYHRSEDIFALPLQLHALRPDYRLYLRRFPYIPAWDLNLYAV